ncbi:MAG TPA: carboxypeptidase regulatory-like domain-containing protein [Bdellovibrionota bacterium]|nr:carboxypeptidase regulatory-like domain-containing protein [Bdellovibrionota bacterium]
MGRVFRHPLVRGLSVYWSLFLAALLLILAADARWAWGYVQTVTPSGVPVQWRQGFKFNVAGNPTNQTGLNDQEVYASVTRSLQRWQAASGGSVEFDYWQGTDRGVYEPSSGYNGLSSVYFASNTSEDSGISPNVLGLTQVWYNADSGEILEADTVLNDRDFVFTTDPTDTSGYGAGSSGFSSGRTRVYVENVLTHELGHSLGLSHSAGLQSTMLFMESPEQAHLGCDEQVGIRALYPSQDAGVRGRVSGLVVTPGGQPIFGAHVLAVSRSRGTVLATGITNRTGAYSIGGLEPGAYYLIAEPYLAGTSALPAYYAAINDGVCSGGEPFRRTILTSASGYVPVAVQVASGAGAVAPALRVNCSPSGDAVSSPRSSASLSSAPQIFDISDPSGFGVVDRFSRTRQTFYNLSGVSGRLEIHALSYSVYSPIHAELSLVDSAGNPVSAQISDRVYTGDSGYVNYDTELVADLPRGDYVLRVSVSSLNVTYYPAGPVMLDSDPFLLITGSVNAPPPALAAILPDNARCRMDERFASYQSPGGEPPRSDTEDGSGGLGFCGTVSSGGGGPGPGPGEIAGWLLPWLLMAAMIPAARGFGRLRVSRPAATL